jgi:site-specific DNA-methyltransferase (adenine-specific)
LFGGGSFQNEIIWSYRRWPTKASRLQRMHDVILFYSIDPEQAKFNIRYQDPTESSKKRWKGKKQNVTFDLLGHRNPTAELSEESVGVPLNDVWQIPVIAPVSKERLGYPTQKPLRLLQQIIDVASDPGDLILDPFCGCGTAVDAAEMLGREWIGIDIAHYAVTLIEERLARWRPGATYEVFGRPTTLAGARDLAQRDKFQFEWWAAWLLGGRATRKKARMMALMGE